MTEEFLIGDGDEKFIQAVSDRLLNAIEEVRPPFPAAWSDEKRCVITLAGMAAVIAGVASCAPNQDEALTGFEVCLREFLSQIGEMDKAKASTDDRE